MIETGIDPIQKVTDLIKEWGALDLYFRRWAARFPFTQTFTISINPASVGANTTSEQTFSVMGLKTTDIVTVNKPTHTIGFGIVGCRVSATDTLAITFANITAAPIDAPVENYLITSTRR